MTIANNVIALTDESAGLIVLGVARSAVCEKTLNDRVAPLERDHYGLVLQKDGSTELDLPPIIAPEKLLDIVKSLEEAMDGTGTPEEKQAILLQSKRLF